MVAKGDEEPEDQKKRKMDETEISEPLVVKNKCPIGFIHLAAGVFSHAKIQSYELKAFNGNPEPHLLLRG